MANNKDFKVKNGIQPTAYHEGLGTVTSGGVGYNLAGAVYDSKSFSVASQDTVPTAVVVKEDGTKMYVIGNTNDSVFQYTLSTAYDVTTASYDSKSFSFASQETNPLALYISPDGTKMYMVGSISDAVFQYTLSTAWDISTASYDSKSLSVSAQAGTTSAGLFFKPDGTKLYISSGSTDGVFQYTLSTAWDVSTASYDAKSFSTAGETIAVQGIYFNDSGTSVFAASDADDSIFQYNLSTAWDASTGSYSGVALNVSSQGPNPYGAWFVDNGQKMYVVDYGGTTNPRVHQYSTVQDTAILDLSTGSVFEITPTSDIQINLSNPADSGTVSQATLLLKEPEATDFDITSPYDVQGPTAFGFPNSAFPVGFAVVDSGSKFFVANGGDFTVYGYNLSTPYDSTELAGTPDQTFTRPAQIGYNEAAGWYMSPDGTHMYYARKTGTYSTTAVYEYALSTPYDLSTTSYVRSNWANYSVGWNGLYMSPDGTKLYITSEDDHYVRQFTLTTPWNISATSGIYSFVSYNSGDTANYPVYGPRGIAFSSNGKYMYIESQNFGRVYEFLCTTPWDMSTSSYTGNSVDTDDFYGSELGNAYAMYFPENTDYLYAGSSTDVVARSSIGVAPTITYPSTLGWPSGTAPTSPSIGETDVLTFSTTDGGTTYQAVQAIDGAK